MFVSLIIHLKSPRILQKFSITSFARVSGMAQGRDCSSIILTAYGDSKKLQVVRRPIEEPGVHEVTVCIKACGINFADLYTRQGLFKSAKGPQKPPFVMGREAAGEVIRLGQQVDTLKVGDRVACLTNAGLGLWTEYANVNTSDCITIPDEMGFDDAAAFFVNYLTAYCAIFYFSNWKENSKIFIHSVAGGIGWAATQLAKTVDNVSVVGTASAWKHDEVKRNGVDVPLESKGTDYLQEVRQLFPKGMDLVLDNRSGADFTHARKMLAQTGKIVHLGANNAFDDEKVNALKLLRTWWDLKSISVIDLIQSNQAVCGFNLDVLKENDDVKWNEAVEAITTLYKQGRVKPRIDSVWTFDQISDAVSHLSARRNIGKIILRPN